MASCPRIVSSLSAFKIPFRNRTFAQSPFHRTSTPFRPQRFLSATPVRCAHHNEQGRANGAKDGRGKRLGAKKTGGELVVPGNIIFRQRGTLWFPGENCDMGRDHTIFATEKGYVRYYRDPELHPRRKYIGVALQKDFELPTPRDEPRRRRLNMVAIPYQETEQYPAPPKPGQPVGVLKDGTILPMKGNYMFRQESWEVARVERRGKIREFKKNDRWIAWRKRAAKKDIVKQKKAEARANAVRKRENKRKGMERGRAIARENKNTA